MQLWWIVHSDKTASLHFPHIKSKPRRMKLITSVIHRQVRMKHSTFSLNRFLTALSRPAINNSKDSTVKPDREDDANIIWNRHDIFAFTTLHITLTDQCYSWLHQLCQLFTEHFVYITYWNKQYGQNKWSHTVRDFAEDTYFSRFSEGLAIQNIRQRLWVDVQDRLYCEKNKQNTQLLL